MKQMRMTTVITLPDADERFLYQYLEANGYGKQSKIAQNTGGFEHKQEANGITVEVEVEIKNVADTIASKTPASQELQRVPRSVPERP